jgi:hypothetical protein
MHFIMGHLSSGFGPQAICVHICMPLLQVQLLHQLLPLPGPDEPSSHWFSQV